MLRPKEIVLITLLVIVGFVMADVIVQSLALYSSLQRFGIRLGIMIQYLAIIYLYFDSRDTARRLRRLEKSIQVDQNNDYGVSREDNEEGSEYE